jgi:hypothetical protein
MGQVGEELVLVPVGALGLRKEIGVVDAQRSARGDLFTESKVGLRVAA